jgi:hypothetical protein
MFRIYERALAIACPILLPFGYHCGMSTQRSAALRLLGSHKWPIPRVAVTTFRHVQQYAEDPRRQF